MEITPNSPRFPCTSIPMCTIRTIWAIHLSIPIFICIFPGTLFVIIVIIEEWKGGGLTIWE
jgi:hypothetical protein